MATQVNDLQIPANNSIRPVENYLDHIAKQTVELQDIKSSLQLLVAKLSNDKPDPVQSRNADSARIWKDEILSVRADWELHRQLFPEDREAWDLDQLVWQERPYSSWAYRLSFPKLVNFLPQRHSSIPSSSRAQVQFEEQGPENGEINRWATGGSTTDSHGLWKVLKSRCLDFLRESTTEESKNTTVLIAPYNRTLKIVDVTPIVALMVLESTPKTQMSDVAHFLERYISFCNWAKASLWAKCGQITFHNAYCFEYHIAFYFVTPSILEPGLVNRDFRGIRKSAAFSPDPQETCKWIHEEQLSIILIGMGRDLFTCYQLGEQWFSGPYDRTRKGGRLFAGRDPSFTPSSIFITWIAFALHHVSWRWHDAIKAVNMKIDTPSSIIFAAEHSDLLSDDPQFSRSKTYFWALQAYQMFDEALSASIQTWKDFEKESLYRVNDGRIDQELWASSVDQIKRNIAKLEEKLQHVRDKSKEVRGLREGLFGASSLFDSRTAVRQGDNIKLLTYINMLFLPLTFATSIFGMGTVLPLLPIKTFAITLPCVSVFTILLVLNLQNITDTWDRLSDKSTSIMRRVMKTHHRDSWKHEAESLRLEKLAREHPVSKAPRRSNWVYALFGLESLFVRLPVHEIKWILGSRSQSAEQLQADEVKDSVDQARNTSRAAKVKAAKVAADEYRNRHSEIFKVLKSCVIMLFKFVRLILLMIWLPLVVLEYMTLYIAAIFYKDDDLMESDGIEVEAWARPLLWLGFNVQHGRTDKSDEENQPAIRKSTSAMNSKTQNDKKVSHTFNEGVGAEPFTLPKGKARRWHRAKNKLSSGLT